jgi:hypothetical protein
VPIKFVTNSCCLFKIIYALITFSFNYALIRTEEHPREVTISELDGSVINEPTLEPLSLSDPSPLTSHINDEETDDDDV